MVVPIAQELRIGAERHILHQLVDDVFRVVLLALSCFAPRKRATVRKGCVFSSVAYLMEARAQHVGSCVHGWIRAASGNVASYSFERVSGDGPCDPIRGRLYLACACASGEEGFRTRIGLQSALPLSAAGFLLLPVIWNGVGGLANACAQLGILVAGIILWCMVADAARVCKVPSTPLFSVCMLCVSFAQLAGTLFGFFRAEYLQPGDIALTAVALAALYAVFMISTFLFKDRRFKDGSDRADASAEDSFTASGLDASSTSREQAAALSAELLREEREAALDARCAHIAERAAFTPREREVFALVARGKTNAAVAEELVVSENTVKFHLKNIYQKLGIHSKTEVMKLIENDDE